MRYWQGDFHNWEKDILFSEYKKEGKHVYSLYDEGGRGYTIRRGFVNRFGYMITDEPLPQEEMTDVEFFKLNPIEDDSLKETIIDLSSELKEAREAYIEKQKKADEAWKASKPLRDEALMLMFKYPLFKKIGRHKVPVYGTKELILQNISLYGCPDDKMQIAYFIRDTETHETIRSQCFMVPRGCHTKTWLRMIEKRENLGKREYKVVEY